MRFRVWRLRLPRSKSTVRRADSSRFVANWLAEPDRETPDRSPSKRRSRRESRLLDLANTSRRAASHRRSHSAPSADARNRQRAIAFKMTRAARTEMFSLQYQYRICPSLAGEFLRFWNSKKLWNPPNSRAQEEDRLAALCADRIGSGRR